MSLRTLAALLLLGARMLPAVLLGCLLAMLAMAMVVWVIWVEWVCNRCEISFPLGIEGTEGTHDPLRNLPLPSTNLASAGFVVCVCQENQGFASFSRCG